MGVTYTKFSKANTALAIGFELREIGIVFIRYFTRFINVPIEELFLKPQSQLVFSLIVR